MISDATMQAAYAAVKAHGTGNPVVLWTEEDWNVMYAVTARRKNPERVTLRVQKVGHGYLKP